MDISDQDYLIKQCVYFVGLKQIVPTQIRRHDWGLHCQLTRISVLNEKETNNVNRMH